MPQHPKSVRPSKKRRQGLLLERLEDRLVFDAAPMPVPVDAEAPASDAGASAAAVQVATPVMDDVPSAGWQEGPAVTAQSAPAPSAVSRPSDAPASPTASAAEAPAVEMLRRELLVIDGAIPDASSLADSLRASAPSNVDLRVELLDPTQDELQEIGEILASWSAEGGTIDAIHLVGHAGAGQLTLGGTSIYGNSLTPDSAAYASVATWNAYLSDGADLLLYGCDLATGTAGLALMQNLSAATGADVAASTDPTGSAAAGGNWILESSTGVIEAAALSSTLEILLPSSPSTTISAPATAYLGESFNVTVAFDNISPTDVGFGPFMDIAIDTTGGDGDGDGLSVTAAPSYLGLPLTYTTLIFDDTANGGLGVLHPYAVGLGGTPVYVLSSDFGAGFQNGDTLLIVQLPFGSFTPIQPPADVELGLGISGDANIDHPLVIASRGGFQFGDDPLLNPATDPSILGPVTTTQVTPVVMDLTKTYIGPEDETATGPNYTRRYRLSLNVADGQTLTDVHLRDLLPDTMQYAGNLTSSGFSSITVPSSSSPGGTLDAVFDTVLGTAGDEEAWLEFDFYVPREAGDSTSVLNPTGQNQRPLENQAVATGTFNPQDGDDPVVTVSDEAQSDNTTPDPDPEHELEADSLAVQKSFTIISDTGGAGPTPGDVLEYTIDFEVSDYYAFDNIVLSDLLSDGQRFNAGFTPTLTINGNTYVLSSAGMNTANWEVQQNFTGAVASGNFTVDPAANDGTTRLVFNVSNELILRSSTIAPPTNAEETADQGFAAEGKLLGGGVRPTDPDPSVPNALGTYNAGPTTGRITYRVTLQDQFTDAQNLPGQSGEATVNPRDVLTNDVDIQGRTLVLTDDSLDTAGATVTEDSHNAVTIEPGDLQKTVYAINGVVGPTAPLNIQPGDTVTYRITYTIPTGDVENLRLRDFLPLPIFQADDPDLDGIDGALVFDTSAAGVPAAGFFKYGPSDSLGSAIGTGFQPTATFNVNNGANNVLFTYGTYSDPTNTARTADILFTVRVSDAPFADSLFLTNLAQSGENSTQQPAVEVTDNQIVQVILNEPTIGNISKGVVGYESTSIALGLPGDLTFTPPSAPPAISGTPVTSTDLANLRDSDLTSGIVDAGDTVRFALGIENQGRADAYDVMLADLIRPSYVAPTSAANFAADVNLSVFLGNGVQLTDGQLVDSVVLVATTGNLAGFTAGTLTGSPRIIDGQILELNDRVLVKDQSNAFENGIYSVSALTQLDGLLTANSLGGTNQIDVDFSLANVTQGTQLRVNGVVYTVASTSGQTITLSSNLVGDVATGDAVALYQATLTRAVDFDTAGEFVQDQHIAVLGGTANGNQSFQMTSAVATLNTDDILYTPSPLANPDYFYTYDPTTRAFSILLADGAGIQNGGLNRGRDSNGIATTDGSNILIVTYDLTLASTANASSSIVNTASLTNYASVDGGTDFTTENPTDTANVTVRAPLFTKELTSTQFSETGNNAANQAVIGEEATYTLRITIPEGRTLNAQVVDLLDPGMQFVAIDSVSVSPGLTVPGTPTTGSTPSNVTIGANGSSLTFNLGDVVNSNTVNATAESIVIVYRVVVLNTNTPAPGNPAGNQATSQLVNEAELNYSWVDDPAGGTQNGTLTDDPANNVVTVVEPTLLVDKQASADNSTYSDTLSGVDADDVVFYRIWITNPAAGPSAYDITLSDPIPAFLTGVTVVSVNVTNAAGGVGGSSTVNGVPGSPGIGDFDVTTNLLTIDPGANIDLGPDTRLEIIVSGTLLTSVAPDQTIDNTAAVTWSSLDGTPANERDGSDGPGADGSVLNNYVASDSTRVRIDIPVLDKQVINTSESFTPETISGTLQGRTVAVGEIVRYRLVVSVPEGTSNDLQLVDRLPAGMAFVNDGTAMVAFVSQGAGQLTSNTITDSGAYFTGVAIGTVTPSFSLIDGEVSNSRTADVDAYDSGTDVIFKLGNVTNTNTDDANDEYIVIEFNALVLNTAGPGNQSGTALNNDFQYRLNGSTTNTQVGATSVQDSDNRVVVAEPNLTVAKTASTTGPVDAGDTFSYTITIQNNATGDGATPAFDIHVRDLVDQIVAVTNPTAELEFLSYTVVAPANATLLNDSSSTATDTLDLTFARLDAASTITITVNVQVRTGSVAGAEIENHVAVDYSSLPGGSGTETDAIGTTYGTTNVDLNPGVDSVLANASDPANNSAVLGANAGERTGADVPNPTNNSAPADNSIRNNYAVAANSPAGLTVRIPSIDKTFQNGSLTADDTSLASSTGSNVVIGETITYDILVTLPEGVTSNLRVEDLVPAGLRIDSIQILVDGSSSMSTTPFTGTFGTTPTLGAPLNGASTLTLDFDDVTVPDDNITANNSFVIRVVATVTNISANQQTLTRTNTARLLFNDPDGAANAGPAADRTVNDANPGNDPLVTIVEPTLAVSKTGTSLTPFDAAATVNYSIALTNSSGQTAYDVTLLDNIDSNLVVTAGVLPNASIVASAGATVSAGAFEIFEISPGVFVLRTTVGANVDIPTGESVTINYDADIRSDVIPGATVNNVANVRWTSLDGVNADERTGEGIPNPAPETLDQNSTAGPVDNYAISDSTSFTVNSIQATKNLIDTSLGDAASATIGEVLTYRITITLPEGLTPDFQIRDALPAGVSYIPGSVTLETAGFVGTVSAPAVSPAVFGDGTDILFDFSPITVTANNITNDNTFSFTYQAVVLDVASNNGLGASPTSLVNTATHNNGSGSTFNNSAGSASVEVEEPLLTIDKAISTPTGDSGDPLTYTLTVAHDPTSNSTAYDLDIADTLPPEFTATSFTAFIGATDVSSSFLLSGQSFTTVGTVDLLTTETLVITFTGTINVNANPSEIVPNSANLEYSSYPLDRSEAGGFNPNTNVDTDHERTRTATDTVNFTVPGATFSKTLFSTSETATADPNVAIGETITYALVVTLPEGTTPDLTIVDNLPVGLAYLSHSVVTTATGSGGLLTADFVGSVPTPVRTGSTGSGDDQTFTFTAITVTGDNLGSNNRFLILVTAQVLDVSDNANGDVLTNTATFDISTDGQPPTTPPGVDTTVVEPLLQIVKSHDDADRSVTPGQTINYTLVISHQAGSTATAFDVAINDPIPTGLTLVGVPAVATTGSPVGVGTVGVSGGVLSLNIDELPVGSTVTITYSVIVDLTVTAGSNLDNNARIYWDGLEANDDNTVNPNDSTTPADGGDRDYGPGPGVEATNPNPDTDPAQDTERVTIGTASISNFVWNDLDGDGAQDALEPGIGGVRVWVDLNGDGTFDATEPSAITDANGQYLIGNLAAGTYTVRVDASTLPNDVTGTATFDDPDVAGTPSVTGNTAIVQLSAGENEDEVDFGYVGSASIGDLVWLNFNGNALQDGLEPGIGNVTVNLYRDLNGDGDLTDPGDGLIATTVTGNTLTDLGNYLFSGLIGGNYVVIVDTSSPALAGATPNYDLNDGTVGPDASSGVFPLGSDEDKDDVDFGFVGNAAIGDRIWYDLNGDGLQTLGEPGVAGVTVNLYKDFNGDGLLDAGDLLIGTTTTVADGIYGFSGLIGDNYLVEVVDGPGTPLESASNTYDKDDIGAGNNDSVGSVVLSAGETDNAVDFGYQGPYSISGTVYHDRDKDSSIDPTDTGIGGTTLDLYLDTNNDGAIDAGDLLLSSVVTAADGTYSFSGLLTGNYLVRETQPIGYGNSETPTNLIDVTIVTTNITDQDFGETTGSIAGVVYRDDDNDALQDPGEPGIANVNVTLGWSGLDGVFGTGDDEFVTIQTDANGAYLFDTFNTPGFASNGDSTTGLLAAGIYRIVETQPLGYVDGAENTLAPTVNPVAIVGTQQGRFGNDQIGDTGGYIEIFPGQDVDGFLFGELQPNLSVTKDDMLTEAAPGDTLTYTIIVTNETFQHMSGVTVVDTLPDDILDFVTATGAPFTEVNGVVTFDVGDMDANEVIILTVTAQVRAIVPAAATEFTNLVTVTDDGTAGPDLDPTDNSFTDTDQLPATPDLTIFKTDYQTTVTPGQVFSYDVIVQNIGNQGATGVVVVDTLPPGLIFVAASDGGTYDALTGEVTFPPFSLPTNNTRTFTITVQVPFDARTPFTTYTNYASVHDDGTNGPDPTPENNQTQDTDTLFFFGFDFFNNLSLIPDDNDDFFAPVVYEKPNLPIDPMFTGITDPGTTLYGVIYDERGLVLGTQTVVADAAGNWSMTFPGAVINKQPHRMEVQQTLASYNHSDQSGYNLRRFFHPTVHSTLFFSKNDTPESVMRAVPSKVLQSMSMNNARPLTSDWSLHSYEYQMSSVNPADR